MARPPRLPDATILALIEELRSQHAVLTGTRLRETAGPPRPARRRHPPLPPAPPRHLGARCALAHAFALRPPPRIAERRPQRRHRTADPARGRARTRAPGRAPRGSPRDRWATEIHRLREEARGYHDASHRLRMLEQDVLDRSRELASAHLRIADLEARLR